VSQIEFRLMQPLQTLLDRASPADAPVLIAELRQSYGGDLQFPQAAGRPYVIGNFVASVDGIVSYRIPGKAGGGEISGFSEPDRFVMGLLRASADAVMIGAGTLQATAARHVWTPEAVYADAAAGYREYRGTVLGKPAAPITVVVSASGVVDLSRPMFRNSAIPIRILTTGKGRDRLHAAGAADLPSTEVAVLEHADGTIHPATMLEYLHQTCGVRLLLHEGGPKLFGEFVGAALVDEFFLTISPQIVGVNSERPRPTMVWGTDFTPETAPWLRLLSIKQHGEHLFLRYSR
jgi:riboflavin biosynthesis pyrimidine reductase